jgi:hypothetical protein
MISYGHVLMWLWVVCVYVCMCVCVYVCMCVYLKVANSCLFYATFFPQLLHPGFV